MDKTLAARLSRIRSASKAVPPAVSPKPAAPETAAVLTSGNGWSEIDPFVRFRAVRSPLPFALPSVLDPALDILCPGSIRAFPDRSALPLDRLLFFDLETTGLSGGAGTVAFLSAFARFERRDGETLFSRRQYLLLDYPGEPAFLESVRAEFDNAGKDAPVLVSYNGRAFDMQLLRTRCLMNAMVPPDPAHLDLVYAARRLWRRSLENCSLSTIEREALGVDRGDDLPGSQAPDAWFDFVKRGDASRLLRICDHNLRDLEGLAALLARLDSIARDPVGAVAADQAARVDPEALALRWTAALKAGRGSLGAEALAVTARRLLEAAARSGSFRAAFILARECAAEGDWERAASLRAFVARAEGGGFPPPSPGLRAAACRLLAVDAARRLGSVAAARLWVDEGLSITELSEAGRGELERLRSRFSAPQ